MKYLFLLYAPEEIRFDPANAERLMTEFGAAKQAMSDAGVLLECEPLEAMSATTTVRVRNGETLITDGPAAEIKELLGGFTLVDCADLDQALKWAATIPTARDGSVEVRPVMGAPT